MIKYFPLNLFQEEHLHIPEGDSPMKVYSTGTCKKGSMKSFITY